MKHFLLSGHGGAYNHGAEAITKATIGIIREKYPDAQITLSSHFPEQDVEFNINADVIVGPNKKYWDEEKRAYSAEEKERFAALMYAKALNTITHDTTLIALGGDNFCYTNWHRQTVFVREALKKEAKSILLGCSVGPDDITDEMASVLSMYNVIIARESLTYDTLKARLKTDVQLLPDPAFSLLPESVALPHGFDEGGFIGINISPLVMRREKLPGIIMENIRSLLRFILSETDMNIALIPHVVMPMDNDYTQLSMLYSELSWQEREKVWLVSDKLGASEYKHVISKCKLLVCSRTHASIAAYSSGLSALVIGYSIKSKGIAKDLGMSGYVAGLEEITTSGVITDLFSRLYSDKQAANALKARINTYIEQANNYSLYI